MKKLFALRGAVCVLNNEDDIVKQIAGLYDELLSTNQISEPDIVSLIFSVTDDIIAKNPAAALRKEGRASSLALFSVQESASCNAPKGIIRVLLHCYMEEDRLPCHVYCNGAEFLRPDFANKTRSK